MQNSSAPSLRMCNTSLGAPLILNKLILENVQWRYKLRICICCRKWLGGRTHHYHQVTAGTVKESNPTGHLPRKPTHTRAYEEFVKAKIPEKHQELDFSYRQAVADFLSVEADHAIFQLLDIRRYWSRCLYKPLVVYVVFLWSSWGSLWDAVSSLNASSICIVLVCTQSTG